MSVPKITRHQMREYAFMITFEMFFHEGDLEGVLKYAEETELIKITPSVLHLVNGVEEQKEILDERIVKHLKKWSIDRISKASLAVLRIAMFEILNPEDEIDIVISEAVKVIQTYSMDEDVSFVNGVLSSIAKEQTKKAPTKNKESE